MSGLYFRMEQLGSYWQDFLMKFDIWIFFRKIVEKIQVFFFQKKSDNNNGRFFMKTHVHL